MILSAPLPDAADFIRSHTEVMAPGLIPEIRLHLATDVTPLWSATQAFLDQHGLEPPFWAFAWPGGQALARLILDQPSLVRGRRVLSFAAGGGVEAIAAARAGAATVVANDIDAIAQQACALNAALNGVRLTLDGRDLLGLPEWDRETPDVILAGDVCYDRVMAARVIPWLRAWAAAGVTVLMADPGRSYLPEETDLTVIGNYRVPTSQAVEDAAVRQTRIYRWIRQAG